MHEFTVKIVIQKMLFKKEGMGEGLWIEGEKIIDTLACAYKFDRDAELLLDDDGAAAFCCSIHFSEDDAGKGGKCRERLGILQSILPNGGIKDKERLMGRIGNKLVQASSNFLKLVHKMGLIFQAPGGVDDQIVGAASKRCLQAIKGARRRIALIGTGHEVDIEPFCPDG